MQVFVKGHKDKINLTKNHFVASGGEGSIYARRGIVYKIYQDPKVVIPYSKMKELSSISNSNVIKPENLVLSNKNKPIGYTMKHVPKALARHHISIALLYLRTGDVPSSRDHFQIAARTHSSPKYLLFWAMSFTGSKAFSVFHRMWEALSALKHGAGLKP